MNDMAKDPKTTTQAPPQGGTGAKTSATPPAAAPTPAAAAGGSAAPAPAAAAPAAAPAPEKRYWLGTKYSQEGSALSFIMKKCHEKPGIGHAELKKAVIDGYKRKSVGDSDGQYAQSLITYAVKNGNLTDIEANASKDLPIRVATSTGGGAKANAGGLSETSVLVLQKMAAAGQDSTTVTFSRDKISELTGKSAAALVRTLTKLVKEEYLVESKVEGATHFALTSKGVAAKNPPAPAAATTAPAPATTTSPPAQAAAS